MSDTQDPQKSPASPTAGEQPPADQQPPVDQEQSQPPTESAQDTPAPSDDEPEATSAAPTLGAGQMYVARESAYVVLHGEHFRVHKGVTRVHEDHPLRQTNPHWFEPLEATYRVEDAQARPAPATKPSTRAAKKTAKKAAKKTAKRTKG